MENKNAPGEVPNWLRLLAIAGVCSILLFGLLTHTRDMIFSHQNALDASTARAAVALDPPEWRRYRHQALLNGNFDLIRAQAWRIQTKTVPHQDRFRCNIVGRFASASPVWFVTMDSINADILQAGNTPIVDYSQSSNGNVLMPAIVITPCVGDNGLMAFIQPRDPARFPTSKIEFGALLLNAVMGIVPRPVEVRADLWADQECFCTEDEAKAMAK